MRASRGLTVALAAAMGFLCAAPSAFAQESGSFSAIATYVRDFTSIEHADGTYFGGNMEGSVTTLASSGEPFVVGGHSLSTCVVLGKRSAAGFDLQSACTITAPSGDTLYLTAERRAGDVQAGSGGQGELELAGGTGVFAGLAGRRLPHRLPREQSGGHDHGLRLAEGVRGAGLRRGRRPATLRGEQSLRRREPWARRRQPS